MDHISIILEFKDLFDEEPQSIDSYLSGIKKEVLIDYAIYYCSLSTKLEPTANNILFAFLRESDLETDYLRTLKNKIEVIVDNGNREPSILNIRTSLKFFELVKGYNNKDVIDLSDVDIRQRLLKVYLLLNNDNEISFRDCFNEMVIAYSLIHTIYADTNLFNLRIVELIKSCIFLDFCEKNLSSHLNFFLLEYGIDKWQDYTLYLHQIGMLLLERDINEPVSTISVPIEDNNYKKKIFFLDKFCIQEIYHNDKDYTLIKNSPIIKKETTNEYCIIFEKFFVEKIYKSLYFKFNAINDSFKGKDNYIKNFRSDIGLLFSEKNLLNKILKDSFGNKYKHLGYDELKRDGNPDYYIRDGKNILLFECKDNLIKKEVVESGDVDVFIDEMRHIFLENSRGKRKAIKQLINNIEIIRKGLFYEDKGININNNVIYPIIVTHNSVFSLPGVNILINQWFNKELNTLDVEKSNIKNLTIIDIDTLVLFQGIFPQNGMSIRKLVDSYWLNNKKGVKKQYKTEEQAVFELMKLSQSFKDYTQNCFGDKNIFTKEVLNYNKYFEDK